VVHWVFSIDLEDSVMSKALSTLLALGFLMSPVALACGGDRTERGLAPAEEPAVPESASALDETEAERRAGAISEEQARERKLFQEAARGGADAAMGGVGEQQMEAVEREEKLVDEELSEEEQKN
jgi:hypothetical protein